MWPFTGKRIFGSRWWALGFVAFVCWQVVEFTDPPNDDQTATEVQDTQKLADTFNAI
jgi:hypothetical protein